MVFAFEYSYVKVSLFDAESAFSLALQCESWSEFECSSQFGFGMESTSSSGWLMQFVCALACGSDLPFGSGMAPVWQ